MRISIVRVMRELRGRSPWIRLAQVVMIVRSGREVSNLRRENKQDMRLSAVRGSAKRQSGRQSGRFVR